MRILVACEESQAVTKAFRALGHKAFSCDILPCSGGHPEWHIQKDVLPLLKLPIWDMIIAFPPCTYLSKAGAAHLLRGKVLNKDRYEKGLKAIEFFYEILNSRAKKICVENPMHFKMFQQKLPRWTQEIQPWQFGHEYRKTTRLWLKNLPPLMPTRIVKPIGSWCGSGKTWENVVKHRDAKTRSKTFPGIAAAMAEQWGQL